MINEITSQKPVGKRIWIDLDNALRVRFFVPIIRELKRRECSVFLTARDCFPVDDFRKLFDLKCRVAGRKYGRHEIMKVVGTYLQGIQSTRIATSSSSEPIFSAKTVRPDTLMTILNPKTFTVWRKALSPFWSLEISTREMSHRHDRYSDGLWNACGTIGASFIVGSVALVRSGPHT